MYTSRMQRIIPKSFFSVLRMLKQLRSLKKALLSRERKTNGFSRNSGCAQMMLELPDEYKAELVPEQEPDEKTEDSADEE